MITMETDQPPIPVNVLDPDDDVDVLIENLLKSAPPIQARPFEDVCEYIENRSLTFKMFRNEFSVPATTKSQNKLKNNLARKILQEDFPKKPSLTYFVPLPYNRSYFSTEEMVDLYAVYSSSPSTECPTSSQFETYKNCLENIQRENNEYLQHIKRRWLEESWTRINVINEDVSHFIPLWWKARIKRVRNYAESYAMLSPVSLTPLEIEGKLVFLKNLVQYGSPTRYYSMVNLRVANPLSVVRGELMKRERSRIKQKKSALTDLQKEVNDDKLAEKFALEHQAQIVTTPSVLATVLANTPGTFEETWCIPFTVKEFNSGDQCRKIIFMDKKLPPSALSISEKNSIYCKAAVRAIFRKSKHSLESAISKHAAQQHSSVVETDADNSELDSEEGDEAGIDNLDPQKLEEETNVQESAPKKRKSREEVSYDLWEYSAVEEHSVLSKHHRKPFKILMKTTTEGKNFDLQRNLLPCVIMTKMEYQPEYGASLMSFRELMKEWINLTLRPGSFLHRVRVDPVKGITIMVESKTATTVANECQRLHSQCVRRQLSILQRLFDHLSPLPVGKYLLNHTPKDKGFMYIFHELQDKKKRAATNLNIWGNMDSVDVNKHADQLAPWNSIDPTIMTPTLHALRRIPCVFPPARRGGKKIAPAEIKKKKKKSQKRKAKKKANAQRKLAAQVSNSQEQPDATQPDQPDATQPDRSRQLMSYDGVFCP